MLAFVYAGQGSQYVGMGEGFADEVWSEEQLKQTKFVQPAIVSIEIAITDALKEAGICPDVVAGLSLGEYAALYASGVWDKATTMDIIAYRGKVMQQATAEAQCIMTAILGLDSDLVKKAIDVKGFVQIANYNCTGQIVIAGEAEAVIKAAEKAKELGARKCIPLNTSGPFHTSLMEDASQLLAEKFKEIEFSDMKIPVISNVTGEILQGNIAQSLVAQVKSPVQFEKTIQTMQKMGVTRVIEIGPGKVLSGFIKKQTPQIQTYNIETRSDFECVKQQLLPAVPAV